MYKNTNQCPLVNNVDNIGPASNSYFFSLLHHEFGSDDCNRHTIECRDSVVLNRTSIVKRTPLSAWVQTYFEVSLHLPDTRQCFYAGGTTIVLFTARTNCCFILSVYIFNKTSLQSCSRYLPEKCYICYQIMDIHTNQIRKTRMRAQILQKIYIFG